MIQMWKQQLIIVLSVSQIQAGAGPCAVCVEEFQITKCMTAD